MNGVNGSGNAPVVSNMIAVPSGNACIATVAPVGADNVTTAGVALVMAATVGPDKFGAVVAFHMYIAPCLGPNSKFSPKLYCVHSVAVRVFAT